MWGIEYFFDRKMSIGVEAVLAVGFSPSSDLVVETAHRWAFF